MIDNEKRTEIALTEKTQKPRLTIPLDQYAGKWIAVDQDHTQIVASGATLDEVIEAATQTGVNDVVYAKFKKR